MPERWPQGGWRRWPYLPQRRGLSAWDAVWSSLFGAVDQGIPRPDLRWLVGRATVLVASDGTGLEVLRSHTVPGDDYGVGGYPLPGVEQI